MKRAEPASAHVSRDIMMTSAPLTVPEADCQGLRSRTVPFPIPTNATLGAGAPPY